MPRNKCDIPISVVRVDGREGGHQLRDDLALGRSGVSPGGKTATNPGRGVSRPDQY